MSWLREAISDGDGLADMAYVAIGSLTVAAIVALGFIFTMSAVDYTHCQPITTVSKGIDAATAVIPTNCKFDPLPIGQAAGLIFGAFGVLIGALATYMGQTRKQPKPVIVAPPPPPAVVVPQGTYVVAPQPAEAATDMTPPPKATKACGKAAKGKR